MRQIEAIGQRLELALTDIEARTSSPAAAALLGVGMAVATIACGLVALFVMLKLLTALF